MLLLLASGCGEPSGSGADGPGLQVTEARVRALIPGQDNTVGYFTAHNPGSTEVVLTGASSAGIRAIEMHTTIRDGDVARMRGLEEVVIAPGDTVRFEPGGRHLMLFGVSELAMFTEVVLESRDGGRIPVRFETIAIGGE
jgi:hypothetical protein